MKKVFSTVLLGILCVALALSGCAQQSEPKEQTSEVPEATAATETTDATTETKDLENTEAIKIGLIAPITGDAADYGKFIEDGAEYAAKVINDNGGILGRKVEIVMEDEIGDQQSSINAMMKLFNTDDLAVILGSSGNSNCLAVVDTVSDYKIPVIMNGGNITFDQTQNPWVWQTRMSDATKGEMYAKVLTKVMGADKIAILHMTDAAGGPRERVETALLNNYGLKPVINLTYNQNTETNYDNYILQIIDSGANGLFVVGQTELALIMKSAESLGLNIPTIGPSTATMDTTLKNAGGAAEDWYSITEWTNSVSDADRVAFIKGYAEFAGREPSWAAAVYYDSVFIACEAIKIAGTTDHDAVNAAFEQISGLPGMCSTFSYHKDHTFADSIFLCQVQDGKAVVVENMAP